MKKGNFKTPERKEKTTTTKIADFITTTGFILEMEMSKFFKDNGYKVFVNRYFFDHDENKKREIDIVASKKVNEINIVFVVECKQNTAVDWIFVCSDKKPSRYYNYVKFFPDMPFQESIDKTRIFDHLRPLDNKLPLAQNSIMRHVSGKQNDSKEIYECLIKLPKATIGLIEGIGIPKKRTIFLPIAVFSGQIFTVEYENRLKVKEVAAVQHEFDLESDNYTYDYTNEKPGAKINRDLGTKYLIEFVTKRGIKSFVSDIEKRISKIDINLWPIKEEEEKQ